MSSSGQSLALFYHDVGVFISSTRLSISTPYAAFFVTSVSISTMLTHDVEPVIDTLKSVRRLFSNQVTASCLRLSAGVIEELPVNDGDIMTCRSANPSLRQQTVRRSLSSSIFVATLKSLTNVVMLISFYPIYSIDASPRWIIASLPLRARA
ncbi:hypothetical protein ABHG17_005638, partial [Escherichia coli]